jgi:hypothetical protein
MRIVENDKYLSESQEKIKNISPFKEDPEHRKEMLLRQADPFSLEQ